VYKKKRSEVGEKTKQKKPKKKVEELETREYF